MVTHIEVGGANQGITFKDSVLAHQYCDNGNGIEIGAAAHNPFHLPNCMNISDQDTYEFFKQAQVEMCGSFAQADIFADAACIPLEDSSLDYVTSSHMIEHHPNPLACFLEWARVIKPEGIIFCIFPKRDALPADQKRPITDLNTITQAYRDHLIVDNAPLTGAEGGKGGHYYVYTLYSMLQLIEYLNRYLATNYQLEVVETNETDSKVGNGHEIILRKWMIP